MLSMCHMGVRCTTKQKWIRRLGERSGFAQGLTKVSIQFYLLFVQIKKIERLHIYIVVMSAYFYSYFRRSLNLCENSFI